MDIHLFFSDAKKEKRLVLTVNFFFLSYLSYFIWMWACHNYEVLNYIA